MPVCLLWCVLLVDHNYARNAVMVAYYCRSSMLYMYTPFEVFIEFIHRMFLVLWTFYLLVHCMLIHMSICQSYYLFYGLYMCTLCLANFLCLVETHILH